MALFVGIDLGTTQTAVSVATTGADGSVVRQRLLIPQPVTSLKIPEVRPLLPSVVWMENDRAFVGELCDRHARALVTDHPQSVLIRSIKREMGNPAWSAVISGATYTPYQIAGLILATVKRAIRRAFPAEEIDSVTITIPASFSSISRRETLRAAAFAGFDLSRVRLLDEPVAALLSLLQSGAFASEPFSRDRCKVLVFDMGGGTLDVSILEYARASNALRVLSTSRYNEVAGDDIDLELAALVLQRARQLGVTGFDAEHVEGFGLGLLELGRRVKMELGRIVVEKGPRRATFEQKIAEHRGFTTAVEVVIADQFPDVVAPRISLPTWALLEAISPFFAEDTENDLSRSILLPVEQARRSAGLENLDSIDAVCLTGGSSLFAPVEDTLTRKFLSKPIRLDPFHAVADGALEASLSRSAPSIQVQESFFENLYLQRVGHSFLEVLRAPVKIPASSETATWMPVQLPVGGAAPRVESGKQAVRLDFFRGMSDRDPLMTVAHTEVVPLPPGVDDGASVVRVETCLDADKVFHCRVFFDGTNGSVGAEVAGFHANDLSPAQPTVDTQLLLNGEALDA